MKLKEKHQLLKLLMNFAELRGWDEKGKENKEFFNQLIEYYDHVGFSHILIKGACNCTWDEKIDEVICTFIKKLAEEV